MPERLPLAREGAQETLGQRLRARRTEQGLSVREVARRVQVSPSAISKIETDKYRPSVSTLWAIVSELGISLDELFGGAPEPRAGDRRPPAGGSGPQRLLLTEGGSAPHPRVQGIQRAGSRMAIELDSGVRWERLTPTTDPDADFLFVTYDVGGSSSQHDAFVRHSGREYGLVLRGNLEVTVGLDAHVLGPGDSISFESTTPHRLRNVSHEPVEGVWIVVGRHGIARAPDDL